MTTMATKEATKANPGKGFPSEDPGSLEAIGNRMMALTEGDGELVDAATMTRAIAGKILEGADVDDLLAAAESAATGAEDIIDRPFVITDAPVWSKAAEAYKEGMGVFVILSVQYDDGSTDAVTCGGTNVLTQLFRARELGKPTLDGKRVKFIQKGTTRGYTVLWLAAVK